MKRFRHFRLPVILLVLLLNIFPLKAQNTENNRVVTVGVNQNPPKVYRNQEGEAAGFFIDLLKEIARAENWTLRFVPGTWNECMQNLYDGTIDLLPDVAFSPERNIVFDFNQIPVLNSWSQVYANPKSKILGFRDLQGKRIALVAGSIQQNNFSNMMKGYGYTFETIYAQSFFEAFSMAGIGLADAAVTNNYFGDLNLQTYHLERTNLIFDPVMLYFVVKKGENAGLIETIDRYLGEWGETSGSVYYQSLERLVNPEFLPESHSYHVWNWIIAGLIVLAACIIIFLQHRLNFSNRELWQMNRKLEAEESKFRSYIENSPYGVFVADDKGQYVEVNQVSCRLTGYSKEELQGKKIIDLIPGEAHDQALAHYKKVVTEGKATEVVPYLTKRGEKRFWNVDAVKISNSRFIGFVNDVTEERAIRARLTRLSQIFEHSLNEIYLFDTQTYRFLEVNPASLKNTGYSHTEIKNMTPLNLKLNMTAEEFEKITVPLINGEKQGVVFETQHFRKDGSYYDAEIHLQLVGQAHDKQFSAVVLDITERKRVEKELREMQTSLELQVKEKTRELQNYIAELEQFREATIERELRMEQLRQEIESLKNHYHQNETDERI